MKKGSKVRVLADNRIGIVADQMFFTLGGRKRVRILVKFDDSKQPVWIDRSLLTNQLSEKVVVSFRGEDGETFSFNVEYFYEEKFFVLDANDNAEKFKRSNSLCKKVSKHFMIRFLRSVSNV